MFQGHFCHNPSPNIESGDPLLLSKPSAVVSGIIMNPWCALGITRTHTHEHLTLLTVRWEFGAQGCCLETVDVSVCAV